MNKENINKQIEKLEKNLAELKDLANKPEEYIMDWSKEI